MDVKSTTKHIENALLFYINKNTPHHFTREIYQYSVLPPGKAFRPLLSWCIAKDTLDEKDFNDHLKNLNSNHHLFATAVELHHDYTLIHDDLPDMDNDDIRRGKPSTHKKYGSWQAILTGDGLLNMSYQNLMQLNHPNSKEVGRLFAWAMGPKGLIHGQVLDLSHEMTESFEQLKLTHKLKTARLIQVSLTGSYLLTNNASLTMAKKIWRFGEALGLSFQFLDDLTELSESNLSKHEMDVNPWPINFEKCFDEIQGQMNYIQDFYKNNELNNLKIVTDDYFNKIKKVLVDYQGNIESHLKKPLLPVLNLFNFINIHQ